jgi:hypothetical protein
MKTKTLLEAIESHRPNSRMASRDILAIYHTYAIPFRRLTVLSMFEVPPQVVWHKELSGEGGNWYISIDKTVYKPKTIADFISLCECLPALNLSPKFEGNEVVASLLWNRG